MGLGILLYLLYVVRVGGDFMSGRFLTVPFFAAAVVIACNFRFNSTKLRSIVFVGVLSLGFSSPYPPPQSGLHYGIGRDDINGKRGVNDERGIYYQNAGLLKALEKDPGVEFPDHWYAARGRSIKEQAKSMTVTHNGRYRAAEGFLVVPVEREGLQAVTTWMNVGYAGFYGGPHVHTIDALALAEPLLARLPARWDPEWGPGHFSRIVPEGYVETHLRGKNMIADKNLAAFYDKICHITQGDLLDHQRWVEIWNMNLGRYDHLIDFDFYRNPSELERCLSEARIRVRDPSKYLDLGRAHFNAGHNEKAVAALQRALGLNPLSFNNHYYAGRLYSSNRQTDLASAAFLRVIQLSSGHIRGTELSGNRDNLHEAYKRLTHAYEQTGFRADAFKAAEKALEIKPEAERFYKLGLFYYVDGKFSNAITSYRMAIQLDPANSGLYIELGTALRAQGLLTEAEQAYRNAIRLQPDHPLFYHNLGGLELEQGTGPAPYRRSRWLTNWAPTTSKPIWR